MKLIACFILLGGFFIKAQQPSYVHFTSSNGLSSNTVYYSLQDQSGYFWFTTDKGVVKFNGYSFQNFTTNDGLSDNEIFDAYEDWQGRIWFSCSNGELSYYENGSFYNRSKSSVLSKINTSYLGLKVLSDNKKTIYYVTQGLTVSLDTLLKVKQKTLVGQLANSTLLKNNLGEVISLNYDTSKVYFTNLTNDAQLSFSNANRKVMPRINSKADFNEEAIYYSTENRVIKKRINDADYEILGEFESMVQYLKIIDQTKLYVGTQKGLVIYDLLTNRKEKTLFPESSISSILVDNENHLWITTLNDGIYLLLNEEVNLISKNNGLAFDKTLYLNFADSNTIFAGSNNFYCSFISESGLTNLKLPFERGNGNIRSLRKDNEGNYYLITSIGITKVNSKFQIVQKYITAVKDIYFRDDDSVYIARINGVSVVHKNDFEKQLNKLDYYFFNKLRYKHPTNYFVEAKDLGIFCVGNDGIKVIKNNSLLDFGEKDEFKKNISDVVRTPKGIICIGSGINGIKIVYHNTHYYINNTTGLTSNFITSLALDSKQNLWAGTSNGLEKIAIVFKNDSLTFKISHYTTLNGLIDNSINDLLFFNGKMWLATSRGICIFVPEKIDRKIFTPRLKIEYVMVNDRVYNGKSDEIETSYRANNIKIKYVGLSSGSLNNITYYYRMIGLEENWNSTTSLELLYPSLPPGNYYFEIRAANLQGRFSTPQKIRIIISPEFYQTTWFKGLVLLLVFGVTALIVFFRIRALRKKHGLYENLLSSENKRLELEKEEINMQMKLVELEQKALRLHMNPHFVFNAINAINGFYQSGESELGKKYVTKFSQLLRMLLDYSTQKYISIQQEVDLLHSYFLLNQLRFQDKFEYQIIVDDKINKDGIGIPPMIIQPFVENALIHGIAPLKVLGKIDVKIMLEEDHLACEISDSGIGRTRALEISKDRIQNSTGIKITEQRIRTNYSGLLINNSAVVIEDILDDKGDCVGTIVKFKLNIIEL